MLRMHGHKHHKLDYRAGFIQAATALAAATCKPSVSLAHYRLRQKKKGTPNNYDANEPNSGAMGKTRGAMARGSVARWLARATSAWTRLGAPNACLHLSLEDRHPITRACTRKET